MFRALLAHPQEALNKRHLVYCVRVMSVGCTRIGVACTCFEHYVLILRRRRTNGTWCIACMLCQLAAPGLEWNSTQVLVQPTDITRTQSKKCSLFSAS
jgi:hypothetical protein